MYNPGVVSVCFGRVGGVSLFIVAGSSGSASPIPLLMIWSLSIDLSLKNYSVAIKDAMT